MTTPLHPFPDDVEVAIVSHNNLSKLPGTLQSLADSGCPRDRITVVDVLSTDGTGDWLAREWSGVRTTRLEYNDGPSPGRNVGIRDARLPYVLLMDADVLMHPDATWRLREALRVNLRARCGSPIVVHADRPDTIQYAGGALHFICEAINPWLDRPLAERGTDVLDIGAAPTCALLLHRATSIEIGLFDERYFIGKEDGDFTHRIKMAGHSILEVPDALAFHHSRPRGTWLFYYQIRNRWHFILKNYQKRTILAIIPPLLVHEPLQFAVLALKGYAGVYFKALFGLIALLPSLPRDRALAKRIRRRADRDLLVSGRLIVRDDLAGNLLVRHGKSLYERALAGYWSLLTRTVLR